MGKRTVLVWEIYETADAGRVVIVNIKPYKCLRLTETIMEHIMPIIHWQESGLTCPAAVVMEKWEPVNFTMLRRRIGRLREEDCMKIAVEYAKKYTCIE